MNCRVGQAFEKARASKGVTSMTASDVCKQVLELFPRSEAELGGLDNLHAFVTCVCMLGTTPLTTRNE